MAKIVVENTSPEARQRQLEAKVQVAFAKVASNVLTFLVGEDEGDMIDTMQEFIEIHGTATQESIDPKGIAIRVPMLGGGADNDEDEHINAILRGSLSMVAAMLKINATVPLDNRGGAQPSDVEKSDYNEALEEIAKGVKLLTARMKAPRSARNRIRP